LILNTCYDKKNIINIPFFFQKATDERSKKATGQLPKKRLIISLVRMKKRHFSILSENYRKKVEIGSNKT